LDRVADIPFAATRFIGRNARDTVGVIRGRPAPTMPLARVVVEIDIAAGMVLDSHDVIGHWGTWLRSSRPANGQGQEPLTRTQLSELPVDARDLITAGAPVALGWMSTAGPIALPASWHGDHVKTSATAWELAALPAAASACVTAARSGPRLRQKVGVTISGSGEALSAPSAVAVTLRAERVTSWVGDEIRTVRCPQTSADQRS
jgi:hypothetical protein